MEKLKYQKTSTVVISSIIGVAFLIEVPFVQRIIVSVLMNT